MYKTILTRTLFLLIGISLLFSCERIEEQNKKDEAQIDKYHLKDLYEDEMGIYDSGYLDAINGYGTWTLGVLDGAKFHISKIKGQGYVGTQSVDIDIEIVQTHRYNNLIYIDNSSNDTIICTSMLFIPVQATYVDWTFMSLPLFKQGSAIFKAEMAWIDKYNNAFVQWSINSTPTQITFKADKKYNGKSYKYDLWMTKTK